MNAAAAPEAGGGAGGGFLGWWLGELEGLFPRRHAGRTKPPRRFAVLLLEAGRLHLLVRDGRRVREYGSVERLGLEEGAAGPRAALAAGIARVRRAGLPVVLRLSADEAVVAEDVLPKAALPDLRQIVGHKLDLLTPFTPAQAYFDAVPLDPVGRDRVGVVVVAVPKAKVEEGLRLARTLGLAPALVDIADEGPADPPQLDLTGTSGPKRRRGPSRLLLWPFLLLLPLAIGGAAFAYQDFKARQAVLDERGYFAAGLERRVGNLPALQEKLERLRREGGFIARRRQGQPSALVALETLSRLLPDDVWLDSFSLDGDRLAITGYAPDASELVPLLENAPAFAGVAFQAPSTRVEVSQGDRAVPAERFSVSAKVSPRRDLR
ncbi:MAG: PilN domain-containing protein [Geminicoccaceae bacterium]|nr:PilN domain-containing protein [Geminicoccaceae bacterium]